jgi:type II secretory pathway component GspD/PulD (secretin)
LTPIVGQNAIGFDPTVDVVNSGFALAVRAVASADRRYVTMTVDAAVASPPEFDNQSVSAVASASTTDGTGAGTSTPIANVFQIPIIDLTTVQTGVTVPDRGTILLGGQRITTEVEIESGVPVLSKLPIINRFFTNRSEIRQDSTLLILMKPTIIIQNEEEEKAFPGLLDKLRDPFRGS